MGKRLKKCSASTDAESTTEPSQNVLDDLEVTLKKQKKEIDEDEKTALKKVEEYDCCFEDKDAFGNNERTILVRGFDCSLPRDDVKSALKKYFGSCGEISRVFVPIECQTGSPAGFAFIDLCEDEEKALALDGSYLGSLRLEVRMAKRTVEYVAYPNFKGCKRCHGILSNRRYVNYVRTCRGHIHPWSPESILLRDELRRKVESKNAHEKVEAENQS
ncbi:unnamed protein product [Arabidopsis lyrata]|uniref:polyadenylate-binding protein 2 isoform X2 n=1 Tax=Arabidopsis lyrata subsp. lyrata TaxID=81972 RepID=UPI000A29CCF3|nr:polyadenylate-binding protein 2 isoform X2 [Arabidopsis lyrata subsp. lyrata]CAH8280099.1 unnamed protein product [Arabidopsis lyrata]|eukprot:XP_020871127.1 polyadenylate-binding protein 2 isoform X2 [Arabidopsis lyrata subsp. lyrata]